MNTRKNSNTKEKNNGSTIDKSQKRNLTCIIFISLICLIILTFTFDFIQNQFFLKDTSIDKKATKQYKYLTSSNWINKNNEQISFNNPNKFSYKDIDSGKNVANSSNFTNFIYHNPKKISIYGGKKRDTITILKLTRNTLKIKYNGKSITFKNTSIEEPAEVVPSNTWYTCIKCDTLLVDYILYGETTELTKEYINCYELSDSSSNNPGDNEGYVDHPLAKDAKFYYLNVSTEVVEDDIIIDHTCTCKRLSLIQAKSLYNKNELKAYMFVNDKLEINKVIFFNLDLTKNDMSIEEASKLIDEYQKKNREATEDIIYDNSEDITDKIIDSMNNND